MKHRASTISILGFSVTLFLLASVSFGQPSFVRGLTVSNDSAARTIYWGLHPTAHFCIDTLDNYFGHKEAELPPSFFGVLDVRWVDPDTFSLTCFGQGSKVDFRPSTGPTQVDTFQVAVSDSASHYPIRVSWPAGLSSIASQLRLIDRFPGAVLMNINMLTDTSATISNPLLAPYLIVMRPPLPPPTFSTHTINFGNVLKNDSKTDSLTVKNGGGLSLSIDSVRVVGGEFIALPTGPLSIPAGDSMKFYITFNPTTSGAQSAKVFFFHDAPSLKDSVAVSGTGIQSTFSVNPTSLPFGSVVINISKTDSVQVTNNGGAPLLIDSVRAYSASGYFSVSPSETGSASIGASGGTKRYHMTFLPTSFGAQVGTAVWYSNAKSSPDSVNLAGAGVPVGPSPKFTTVTPESIAALDGAGKLVKSAKRKKHLYPNWTNLVEEVVAQGGFAPPALNGATESDSAGGEVVGIAFMFRKSPDPLAPKWTQIKQTGKSDTAWARLSAWDFKKSKGKSASQLAKTMRNKAFNHWTSDLSNSGNGTPRGFDSTLVPGVIKRKQMKKQMTKLDPKKTPDKLFAELVAFKFNVAASELENTPAGFGDLIYDQDSSLYDEMPLTALSQKADSMMTYWHGVDSTHYAQLYKALYDINRAFVGVLDTVNWERIDTSVLFTRLVVKGNVDIATVPFLKVGTLRPTIILPTSNDTETEEDFEDGDYFDDYEFDGEGTPIAAKLYQNYPNPFNPTTTVSFRLMAPALVTLKVYNVLGQEVVTLLSGEQMDEGYQTVQFNPAGLSSGVYFYQVNAQDQDGEFARTLETKKMLLIK